MSTHSKSRKLFEPAIVHQAIIDSFIKLNPRHQIRNPVMFVVFVGSILTTLLIFVGETGISKSFIAADHDSPGPTGPPGSVVMHFAPNSFASVNARFV